MVLGTLGVVHRGSDQYSRVGITAGHNLLVDGVPSISVQPANSNPPSADQIGAAATGMPIKFTVKETDGQNFVERTIPRSNLWEIQTPQVIHRDLLEKGFQEARDRNLTVTDDVSLVELLQHPVKIVEGDYTNLKITTKEDLALADLFLAQSAQG